MNSITKTLILQLKKIANFIVLEGEKKKMKYHLYDDKERHQGCFESVEKLRNFLCDRKYDISCDADLSCTFDYIKHIKWYFEIEE